MLLTDEDIFGRPDDDGLLSDNDIFGASEDKAPATLEAEHAAPPTPAAAPIFDPESQVFDVQTASLGLPPEPAKAPPAPSPPAPVDSPFQPQFERASKATGVDPLLLRAVQTAETGGARDPVRATSAAGAKGVMQLREAAIRDVGGDPGRVLDADSNVLYAAQYLKQLQDRTGGDIEKAVTAYHMGITDFQAGKAPGPKTKAYVEKVMLGYRNLQKAGGSAPTVAVATPKSGAKGEDDWLTVGRKLIENVPDVFKSSIGGIIEYLGEQNKGARLGALQRTLQEIEAAPEQKRTPEKVAAIFNDELKKDDVVTYGREIYAAASADLKKNAPNVDSESLKGYSYDIGTAMIEMLPMLAVTIATRSPGAGLSVMGGQVVGHSYGESRQEGRNVDQAEMDATFNALAETLPESIPLGILAKPGGKFLSRVLKSAGAENIQEMFTEALQIGYDKGILNKEMTWGEAFTRMKHAGIVGAGAGGGLAVVAHPFVREPKPAGKREQAAQEAPELTPDDRASPLPDDLIDEGKKIVADAEASVDANDILRRNGMPEIDRPVTVTMRDGTTQTGTMSDAFTQENAELGTIDDGVKIALDDGTVFEEFTEQLRRSGVTVAETPTLDPDEILSDAPPVPIGGEPVLARPPDANSAESPAAGPGAPIQEAEPGSLLPLDQREQPDFLGGPTVNEQDQLRLERARGLVAEAQEDLTEMSLVRELEEFEETDGTSGLDLPDNMRHALFTDPKMLPGIKQLLGMGVEEDPAPVSEFGQGMPTNQKIIDAVGEPEPEAEDQPSTPFPLDRAIEAGNATPAYLDWLSQASDADLLDMARFGLEGLYARREITRREASPATKAEPETEQPSRKSIIDAISPDLPAGYSMQTGSRGGVQLVSPQGIILKESDDELSTALAQEWLAVARKKADEGVEPDVNIVVTAKHKETGKVTTTAQFGEDREKAEKYAERLNANSTSHEDFRVVEETEPAPQRQLKEKIAGNREAQESGSPTVVDDRDRQRQENIRKMEEAGAEPDAQSKLKDKIEAKRDGKAGRKRIGENAAGHPLFEDENGVRSYTQNGIRRSEPVQIVPGRGVVIDPARRGKDFSTVAEAAKTVEGQPVAQEQVQSAPEPATINTEKEPQDGIPSGVSERNEGASTEDVQQALEDGRDGRAPETEDGRSVQSPGRNAGERAEGADRASEEPGSETRGGRDSDGATDRVSEGRNASGIETVRGQNFQITPGAQQEERGLKAKALGNIRAIELLHQIEAEGRPATYAEQQELALYVGWGGIKNAFPDTDGSFGKGLEDVGARLRELLSDTEYTTARRSIQYAHYTAENVVHAMWTAAERLGFKGGKVFEPGMGIGNFMGGMPADIQESTDYHGLELDHTTARIARLLYPQSGVRQDDFIKAPLPKDTYDLIIGNPPFSETVIKADPEYSQHGFMLHDFFFAKSMDAVRPGGLLVFISSAGTLNKIDTKARDYLAERSDFLGAIRLPGNAFEKNANTKVTTDVLFFRKKDPNTPFSAIDGAVLPENWVETVEVTLPNKEGTPTKGRVNKFFQDNPSLVLGEEGFIDDLYAGRYAVKAPKGFDLTKALTGAVEKLPQGVMSKWQDIDRAEIDFGTAERKEGAFYQGRDGRLMQVDDGVGKPVEKRGKDVKGGKTSAEIERIGELIPVRDALRAVYDADIAADVERGDVARKALNKAYDTFTGKYGPINKAVFTHRRPNTIQQESARQAAREEARFAGQIFDEGAFDASALIGEGKTIREIAKARREAREAAEQFDEGTFNPEDMADVVIDKRPNVAAFMSDPESYRLRSIEEYDEETGKAKKTDVFRQNILTREKEPEINSIGDAVMHVLNTNGRFDLEKVSQAAGVTESQAIEELAGRIFKLPGTENAWVTQEEYLSGNVRKKLRQAKAAAERNSDFTGNVTALEAAQPAPLPPSEIAANMGMPWIPEAVIEEFGEKVLELESVKVRYMPKLAQWFVEGDKTSSAATATWGTSDRSAPALIQDALNRQDPKVYRETYIDGKKSRELDPVATEAVQDKVREMKARFLDWVWEDPARAENLSGIYNEEYNNLVVREHDGGYLTTPGISSTWEWRPHQKRVVARIIQEGNTYMAHAVGAGKTSAMIGAGMEMRRLGLVRKPMYVVPNHMLVQFTKEFYEQYPTARIAVADDTRFHTSKRKQFVANVAQEDLDAIIITHSAFNLVPVSDEFEDNLVQEQVDEYREVLEDMPDDGENATRITRRRMEQKIEALEQRLSGNKGRKKKDQVFTFEEMGVDFMFIDEAHMFRKLDFATKMTNVKGINPNGSDRAWDLYVKTRYLETIKPGHNLVFASGTPVTNTMAELYTVSRFLQPAELAERGLSHFDAWASAFGDTVTNLEQDPAGGYKAVTRFAQFVNVPELSAMVRQNMDVVTSRQLDQYVTRPTIKGGQRVMNLAERSKGLEAYQQTLARRMKAIAERKGPPQKGDDIILSVIGDGRHAAIDMRFVDNTLTDDPGSKLNLLADNVFRIWEETKRQEFFRPENGGYSEKPIDTGPATQLVFSNLGVSSTRGFSAHKFIVSELVRRGVPRNEVQLISDHKTHVAKQRLFNDINEAQVRITIGSTDKMATGVNVQRRLAAIHNLDPLWFPSDDEQRNGRGIRQGNWNKEIAIHDYSTKGTYDSTMWGLMETKARFIQGFFEGDPTLREMADLGEASQYEQAKALSTADERLITLTDLRQQLERAVRRKRAHERGQSDIEHKVSQAKRSMEYWQRRIPQIEADIARRQDTSGENFKAVANNKKFDDRVEFGDALLGEFENEKEGKEERKGIKLGELGGFDVKADIWKENKDRMGGAIYIAREGDFATEVRSISGSASGLTQSLENILRNFETELNQAAGDITANEKTVADFTPKMGKTFDGQQDINRLTGEVRALEAELEADNKPPMPEGLSEQEIEETPAATTPGDDTEDEGKFSLSRADEAPQPYRDEFTNDLGKVFNALNARLKQVGLGDKVALKFREKIEAVQDGKASEADGRYVRGLIEESFKAVREGRGEWVLNHEIVHGLRDLGVLRNLDWKTLERAALADTERMAKIRRDYSSLSEADQVEEAVADMFADWASEKTQPGGALKRAFTRIRDFFKSLYGALTSRGYKTADSIFEAIERGEVGRTEQSGDTESSRFVAEVENQEKAANSRSRSGMSKQSPRQVKLTINGKIDIPKIVAEYNRTTWRDGSHASVAESIGDFDAEFVAGIEYALYEWARQRGFGLETSGASNSTNSTYLDFSKPSGIIDEFGNDIPLTVEKIRISDHANSRGGESINIAPPPFGWSFAEALASLEGAALAPNADIEAAKENGYFDPDEVILGDATATYAEPKFSVRSDTGELARESTPARDDAGRFTSDPMAHIDEPGPMGISDKFAIAITGFMPARIEIFDDIGVIMTLPTASKAEEALEAVRPALHPGQSARYIVHEGRSTEKFSVARTETGPARAEARARPATPNVNFTDPESEKRWQDARKGSADPRALPVKMGEWIQQTLAGFARHYRELPNIARWADVKEQLRKLEAAPQASKEKVIRILRALTDGMTASDLDLFTRKVVLDDLMWEAEQDHDLPFALNGIEDVRRERAKVDSVLESRPDLQAKIRMRKQVVMHVAEQLVSSGVLRAEQIRNPAYYRHQVLDYARAQEKHLENKGRRLKSPYWHRRQGSKLDINANLLEAEFEWLHKALTDIAKADAIKAIDEGEHNARDETLQNARDHNKAVIDRMLARDLDENGYVTSTGRQTSPLNEVAGDFKKRIALGFKDIREALESGQLDVPEQFEDIAIDLVAEATGEGNLFPFLAWILDNQLPGSMGAATAFKAINARKAWVRDQLGETYADTLDIDGLIKRGFAPEGSASWQPEEGQIFFTSKTIPEHVIDRIVGQVAAMTGEEAEAFSPKELTGAIIEAAQSVRSLLAVGGPKYQMVLPEELANTLSNLGDPHADSLLDTLAATPLSLWKRWVLINPRRVIKYNLNNLSGDLDAVIAGNPKALRKLPQAIKELYDVMLKGGTPSKRYREAVTRGVFDSGLTIQEIPDINYMSEFEGIINPPTLKEPKRFVLSPLMKVWRGLQRYTWFRENWLRYAAYLDYVERLEAGESMESIGYGAAKKEVVDAVKTTEDRAALLARELVGDYGNISHWGKGIRRKAIPFYSWVEINTRRYWRFGINSWSQGVGQGLKTTGLLATTLGIRTTAYLGIRMMFLYGMVQLWNNLMFGDDEDELSDEERVRLHINLGRGDDGEIRLLRFQGAMSDFLEWINADEAVAVMLDIEKGRAGWGDLLKTIAKAPINRIVGGLTPVIKAPLEYLSGFSFWPDAFKPRAIKDDWRHIARMFSVENEYDVAFDRPSRGYKQSLESAVIYKRDVDENAYNRLKGLAHEWNRREKGLEGGSNYVTPRSKALYDFRLALKFKDKDAEKESRKKMRELGLRGEDLRRSVKRAHPLGGVAIKDRAKFLKTLTPKERRQLKKANRWYSETFLRK